MAPALLTALTLLSLQAVPPLPSDSSAAFADAATRALVERGIARRHQADTTVSDYTAQLRYRLTAAAARRKWGRYLPLATEEQVLRAQWHAPNDLRLDLLGHRSVARPWMGDFSSSFDRPWFVPRTVGDSMRIVSDRVPAVGALHPLSDDGPQWYHYALVDSLSVVTPPGRRIRLYGVEVTPRRVAPALVSGRIWLDAETAEVVRFTFRYVGTGLWVRPGEGSDSGAARRANAIANRILTLDADLEYAIEDGRHWMPHRQVIAGTVEIPVVKAAVSFRAVTTFENYEINTGRPVVFALADSLTGRNAPGNRDSAGALLPDSLREEHASGRWPGGRFEINRPSEVALRGYAGWRDSLVLATSPEDERELHRFQADLAGISEQLPSEITGDPGAGVGYQRLTDAFRYDRVQGLSLGAGFRAGLPLGFTDFYATARYGFSDHRVTGRLALVRDAPDSRVVLEGYRDIDDVDPLVSARAFGHSLNALFAGHDEADYYLAEGAGLGYERGVGLGVDLLAEARVEREQSVARSAHSAVNDWLGGTGVFQPNPTIYDGTFGRVGLGLRGYGAFDWQLGLEGLTGSGRSGGRVVGGVSRSVGGGRGATLRLHAGAATTPTLPQLRFRLGGQSTVRGFAYGSREGAAFWSAQFDITPFGGGVQPVFFIDAGQAAPAGQLFQSRALVGGGVGLTLYSPLFRTSLLRFDLSRPLSPSLDRKLRFDIVFQAPR